MSNVKTVVHHVSDSDDITHYSWGIQVFTSGVIICDIRTVESDIHKAIDGVLEYCDFEELPPNYCLIIQNLE